MGLSAKLQPKGLKLCYYNGQGRYDVVCPMMSAWDLHKAWPEADLKVKPKCFIFFSEFSLSLFLLVGNATSSPADCW